jgi:hypothetical protein
VFHGLVVSVAACASHQVCSTIDFAIFYENILDRFSAERCRSKLVPINIFDLLHHLFEGNGLLRQQIALWFCYFHSLVEILRGYFGSDCVVCPLIYKIFDMRRFQGIGGCIRSSSMP